MCTYLQKKAEAKRRNIPFTLTEEQWDFLIKIKEDPEFYKGVYWLALEVISGSYTRDIASESWRTPRESSNQYLPERNFIDPFDPTEQELTMFELLYGTDSKEEYLKWMNAIIKFRKQENQDEKQV